MLPYGCSAVPAGKNLPRLRGEARPLTGCIGVLTRHRLVQAGLLASLAVLVVGPVLGARLGANLHLGSAVQHEAIAVVARHVFAPGRVTVHRVHGAVLLYLNVAALFAIAYGFVVIDIPARSSRRTSFRPRRPVRSAPPASRNSA